MRGINARNMRAQRKWDRGKRQRMLTNYLDERNEFEENEHLKFEQTITDVIIFNVERFELNEA